MMIIIGIFLLIQIISLVVLWSCTFLISVDKVRLSVISGVFQQHRLLALENCLQLEYSELEAILSDIFFAASKESRLKPSDYDVEHFTELTLNFLISVFDK